MSPPAATQWSPSVHRWMARKARRIMRVHNLVYKEALREVALMVAPKRRPPTGGGPKRSGDLERSRRNRDAGVVQ